MLVVTNTQALTGLANTASAVKYTVIGRLKHQSVEPSILAQGTLGTTSAALYTPTAGDVAEIQTIVLANTTDIDVSGNAIYLNSVQVSPLIRIPGYGSAVYGDNGWQVSTSAGNERIVQETKIQTDASDNVVTFSKNISYIEIINTDTSNNGSFTINGIAIHVPASATYYIGSWKGIVGGTPGATVTVSGATSYILNRYR